MIVQPTYSDFVASKQIAALPAGLSRVDGISDKLFPFQRDCVEWALRRGRAALFEDCGLGKTPQQLEWARIVARETSGQVLVLAPLAVAQQTIREGEKFGVPVVYARDQSEARGPVVVTNYERLAKFNARAFAGVVLDESSILKAFMGKVKRQIVDTFAETPFKLACTATPAPNDHLELGNHAEFLGVLSSHEMIARWFLPDTSTFGTYRLKGHAVEPFWNWVSTWARCVGKPSDLGSYSDDGYVLPELRLRRHVVEVDVLRDRGGSLFRSPDLSATSVHREKRLTVAARAAAIASLVTEESREPWIVWCDTDYEADALVAAIPGAVEVRGSHPIDRKERDLRAFTDGTTRVLVTKPSIAGYGLNWQHCARVAFVGPTFSFEKYYQAIRRSWRFGQHRPVDVHVAMGQTESEVWQVMQRKADDHAAMMADMFAAARRAQSNEQQKRVGYEPRHAARLPSWLASEGSRG